MEKEKKAEYKTLLRCFNTVIFYNGYSDFFRDVYGLFRKYMEKGGAEKHEGYFSILERLRDAELDRFAYGQIQALRMMLVEMFGECGTSPRTGWITDEKGFDEFMSDLIRDLEE